MGQSAKAITAQAAQGSDPAEGVCAHLVDVALLVQTSVGLARPDHRCTAEALQEAVHAGRRPTQVVENVPD
jgi:hypothetical protein